MNRKETKKRWYKDIYTDGVAEYSELFSDIDSDCCACRRRINIAIEEGILIEVDEDGNEIKSGER